MRVTAHIVMNATPAAIFHALTDEAAVRRYFPYTGAAIVPRPGGEITLTGRTDDGAFTDYGRVVAVEPNRLFSYRYWSNNHGTPRRPENEVTLTYKIEIVPSGTRLSVEQRNLPSGELADTMDVVWPMLLGNLKSALED